MNNVRTNFFGIESIATISQRKGYWLTFIAVLLAILTAMLCINWLKTNADEAHQSKDILLDIDRLINEQSALEWQAIALQQFSPQMAEQAAALSEQLSQLFNTIQQRSQKNGALELVSNTFHQYQTAVEEEFRLLALGKYERAVLVDENQVDPTFVQLRTGILQLSNSYNNQADQANRVASIGAAIIIALTALIILGLIWRFESVWQASDLLAAEQQMLRRSEEHFRALVRNALDIIMVSDLEGTIRYVSPSCERILGYTPQSLMGLQSFTFAHPDDLAHIRHELFDLAHTPNQMISFEVRIRRHDGAWCYLEATGHNLLNDPNIQGIIFNARDSSERKEAEAQLQHQVFHDPLTQLPNRLLFQDRLHQALARTGRQSSMAAILFLDLDNFQVINDSLGHEAGDELLVKVAKRLNTCIRPGDTVARLGGDEFTVLLEDLYDSHDIDQTIDRVQSSFLAPLHVNEQEVFSSVSIGIAISTPQTTLPGDLIRAADIALYQAKAQGKGKSVLFNATMDVQVKERLLLETELRRALDQNELVVYYQPIVELTNGHVVGMEALVRWNHPQRGMLAPAAFIPIAEETGLIIPIGQRVLEIACQQISHWQQEYAKYQRLRLNVNLSVRQFQHPALISDIKHTLESTGMAAQQLEFEITESLLLEDNLQTQQILRDLKNLGVHLALDDFGTGYSSLSYLHRFAVDTVKIDRSFVKRLGANPEATSIINAMMTFAQILNLQVTAEGIETDEQYGFVRNMGCQFGQGYYFTKPLPYEDICQLLTDAGYSSQNSPHELLHVA